MKQHIYTIDLELLTVDGFNHLQDWFGVDYLDLDTLRRVTVTFMFEFLNSRRAIYELHFNLNGFTVISNMKPVFHKELFNALWKVCAHELNIMPKKLGRTVVKKSNTSPAGR